MPGVVSSIFGGSPSVKYNPAGTGTTLLPSQQTLVNQLASAYGAPRAPSAYQGPLTAGMTDTQLGVLGQILGIPTSSLLGGALSQLQTTAGGTPTSGSIVNAAQGTFGSAVPGVAPITPTAVTPTAVNAPAPIRGATISPTDIVAPSAIQPTAVTAGQITPQDISNYFQKSIAAPLSQTFAQRTIPAIEAAFGRSAASLGGTDPMTQVNFATQDLTNAEASALGTLNYQAAINNANNALQANIATAQQSLAAQEATAGNVLTAEQATAGQRLAAQEATAQQSLAAQQATAGNILTAEEATAQQNLAAQQTTAAQNLAAQTTTAQDIQTTQGLNLTRGKDLVDALLGAGTYGMGGITSLLGGTGTAIQDIMGQYAAASQYPQNIQTQYTNAYNAYMQNQQQQQAFLNSLISLGAAGTVSPSAVVQPGQTGIVPSGVAGLAGNAGIGMGLWNMLGLGGGGGGGSAGGGGTGTGLSDVALALQMASAFGGAG